MRAVKESYLALSAAVMGEEHSSSFPSKSDKSLSFPLPMGEPLDPATGLADRYIVLNPYARGEGKSLSPGQIQSLCSALSPRQIVVVGNGQQAPFPLSENALVLLNQTSLLQLVGLIRRASFVISVDSGPAHLAAALDRPMLSIHSWTDPRRVGPYRPDAWVLKNGELFQMLDLRSRDDLFFQGSGADILPPQQLEAVCRLTISSSDSSA